MKKFRILLLAVLSLFVLNTPKEALAQGGGNEYRVEARMGGGNAPSAKAKYRERIVGNVLIQRFSVSVERMAPGVPVQITINGVPFGTIVPNALGRAELEFKTFVVDDNPHDENPPLPTDFPHINAGVVVTVGTLSGTFQLR
jgi:antitoxin (DNA-binding transcriptional repressor) of toxin-antitoxin stability system